MVSWDDHPATDPATDPDRGGEGLVVVWEIQPGGAEVVEPGGADVVDAVYAATHRGLEVVQSWLAGIGPARWWC